MKKIMKGYPGYFAAEKKRRAVLVALLFLLPALIILSGILIFHSEKNILTVVGLVSVIPFAMQFSTSVLVFMQKSIPDELYQKIKPHEGSLLMAYELLLTSDKQNTYVEAAAICGRQIVGLVTDKKADLAYAKDHVEKIMRSNSIRVEVHFLTSPDKFVERLDSMNAHADSLREGISFQADSRYPDYTREEVIWHLLTQISL